VRVALQNQRDDLLAFAGVLDDKLATIARIHEISEPIVREACALRRLPSTSSAYWQGWNTLRTKLGDRFHVLFDAVARVMAQTPRSSSLVENLNSRLRNYFTLRRHLAGSYLGLLRFFLNHRRFMRSRHAERNGKSPWQVMTGQDRPHWLTLLGLDPIQPHCRRGYISTANRDRGSTRHSCARAAAASYAVEPKPTRPDNAVLQPRI
jgi:hypothetical protein